MSLDDDVVIEVTRPVLTVELGAVPVDGGGGGTGDVVGPSSATDNAIVRFDGTTGELIQDSNVTISDAGSITVPASQTVDGRDVSADGSTLDSHVAATAGAHGISAFGATLVDDANAAAARSTLGLGGAAVLAVGTTAGTVAAGDDSRLSARAWRPILAGGTTLTNLPAALGETNSAHRRAAHLAGVNRIRITGRVTTAPAGSAGAKIVLVYSLDSGSTWKYFDDSTSPSGSVGTHQPQITLDSNATKTSSDVTIPAEAQADLILGLYADGGDGAADPVLGELIAEVWSA